MVRERGLEHSFLLIDLEIETFILMTKRLGFHHPQGPR